MGIQILSPISAHHQGAHSHQEASPKSPVRPDDSMCVAAFRMAGLRCPKSAFSASEVQQQHHNQQPQQQERKEPVQDFKFGITRSFRSHRAVSFMRSGSREVKLNFNIPSVVRFGIAEPMPDAGAGVVQSVPALPYDLQEKIGSGAYGSVYKAFDEKTQSVIAIKVQEARVEQLMLDAIQEANMLQKLKAHPNLVTMLDAMRCGNTIAICMEYMPGGSISALCIEGSSDREAPTLADIKRWTRQVLCGLAYLHEHNIVHRDIKGYNVLIDADGTAKLADFGASAVLTEASHNTLRADGMRGTVPYMAPEVVKMNKGYKESDIWSLGCLVIEMVTGKLPWAQLGCDNPFSLIYHMGNTEDGPPLPEGADDCLKNFLACCFRHDRKQRPTAEQLLAHAWLA